MALVKNLLVAIAGAGLMVLAASAQATSLTIDLSRAADGSKSVYIGDSGSKGIQVSDSSSDFSPTFGNTGNGNGQFNLPIGVTLNQTGNVYVVDGINNSLQVFDTSGGFITTFGNIGSGNKQNNISQDVSVVDESISVNGSGNGQNNISQGVAVADESGNAYVSDSAGNGAIKLLDASGGNLTIVGSFNNSNGQSNIPPGMSMNGGQLPPFFGSMGSGNGPFNLSQGVAVDGSGNVYVVDGTNNSIEVGTPPKRQVPESSPLLGLALLGIGVAANTLKKHRLLIANR